MTEPAAAPAPEQAPILLFRGQPISIEQATARRAELTGNAEYVKAALGGDQEKSRELADLYMLARGQQPGASQQQPENADDVIASMSQQEIRQELQIEASWRDRVAPSTPQELAEFEKLEATVSQQHAARQFIDRAKNDPDFRRKLLSGNMEARSNWDRAHFVAFRCETIPDPPAP